MALGSLRQSRLGHSRAPSARTKPFIHTYRAYHASTLSCTCSGPGRSILAADDQQLQQSRRLPPFNCMPHEVMKATALVLLGGCWMLGRPPAPAIAGGIRSPPIETVVSIAPQGVATAAVPNESDSCSMLVAVCLGFWMLSATISAAIGAIMKMAGRPMAYVSSSGGSWTSTNVMDMDIMPLPLTYEDEPVGGPGSRASRDNVTYVPWDGPDTYIPVSMVKVFQPGMLEAGRVARPSMLQSETSKLSIISVTRPADESLTSKLPTNGNGGGNGSSNTSTNGKHSSDGSNGSNGSSSGKQDESRD